MENNKKISYGGKQFSFERSKQPKNEEEAKDNHFKITAKRYDFYKDRLGNVLKLVVW